MDNQIGKRRPKDFAIDADLSGLQFRRAVIVSQGHRSGTGVLGNLEPFGGQQFAGLRQRKVIVVADHALHFHQLLLAHVVENDVQYGDGELELVAQALEIAEALQQQPP